MTIFSTISEDGIESWKLVLSKQKTITRRTRPMKIGSVHVIQPKRTMAGVCVCGHFKDEHCQLKWPGQNETLTCLTDVEHTHIQYYTPAKFRVIECHPDSPAYLERLYGGANWGVIHECEAQKEGFSSWEGLQAVLKKTNPKNLPLYRIEIELMK